LKGENEEGDMHGYHYDHPSFLWSISDACHFIYHMPALGILALGAFAFAVLAVASLLAAAITANAT
jgi:hypothetical protein